MAFSRAVMTIFTPPVKLYKGYIFDCDGTLAHSMPVHYVAWRQTAEENGLQMSEELFYSLGGVPTTRIVEILNEKLAANIYPELVAKRKKKVYDDNRVDIHPREEDAAIRRSDAMFRKLSIYTGTH